MVFRHAESSTPPSSSEEEKEITVVKFPSLDKTTTNSDGGRTAETGILEEHKEYEKYQAQQ